MFLTRADELVIDGETRDDLFGLFSDRRPSFDITRALDIAFALTLLIFAAPLMAVLALAIKAQDGGPMLFGQARLGYGGRSFKCWKFRTMVVDAELKLSKLLENSPEARREWDDGHKLRNDPRITPFGSFLRKSSLDELPQLINILRGEMSLVGPRPIVHGEVIRYGRWFTRYCSVRPGLTGLWQVSGRNDIDYRRRVAMDVLFARRRSALFYIGICLATVPSVLARRGSY